MKATVTVRLDDDVNQQLTEAAEALGRSRNDIVRDALRRQWSVLRFETLREQVMPFAEARRVLRDKLDVADQVESLRIITPRAFWEATRSASG